MKRAAKAPWTKLKWGAFTSELAKFGDTSKLPRAAKSLSDLLARPEWVGSSYEVVDHYIDEPRPRINGVSISGPLLATRCLIAVVSHPSGTVARVKAFE